MMILGDSRGGGNLETTPPALPALTSLYVSENGDGDPEIPYDPYGVGVNLPNGYWGAGGGVSTIFAEPFYLYRAGEFSGPDNSEMSGGFVGGPSSAFCCSGLARQIAAPPSSPLPALALALSGRRFQLPSSPGPCRSL